MQTTTAARRRRRTNRLARTAAGQDRGVGMAGSVGTIKQVIAQLRTDIQGGQWVDPAALDMLALGALIDGKPGTAQVLSNLANGRRLDDLLAELEES